MHIRQGEVILKVVKRHLTPYVIRVFSISLISIPIFAILYLIGTIIDGEWIYYSYALTAFLTGVIVAVFSLDYLLDKLVITSKRVIWVNWKTIFSKFESEAELHDIQDIDTKDKGVLSRISFLNYGLLEIQTAAAICVIFKDCPNPNLIKHYLLEQIECDRNKHIAVDKLSSL